MLESNPLSRIMVPDTKFDVLADAMPQIVWSARPDGYHDYFNSRWYEFTGVDVHTTEGDAWARLFHEDDRDQAWERWNRSLETGEPYEIEYRLRHHSGHYRWTLGRALPIRDDDGSIIRWIGTCTDIDDAKRVSDQNELLSQELSHRIKNIFSIISGLINLSVRQDPSARTFATGLQQRITALGRAHEFVRPHSKNSRPAAIRTTLEAMIADMFRPYPAMQEGRIRYEGAIVDIDDQGATPLALLFHELATNAMKYGALSSLDGRVTIVVKVISGLVAIDWNEIGSPRIDMEPQTSGFGNVLTSLSVEQQLGGKLSRKWNRDGVQVSVVVAQDRLAR